MRTYHQRALARARADPDFRGELAVAAFIDTIEINRSAEDVFAYVDDLARHPEWQETLVSVRVETEGPTRVGTRATERRRVPGGERELTYEITEHDPPRRASFRGLNGPIRPLGTVTIEPLDGGSRARVSLEMRLEPHGVLGAVLAPVARASVRKEIPASHRKLKEILERREA